MPGMFGGGGMSAQDISALANQEAGLNRVNTYSPIYGGTVWSHGGGGGGDMGGGGAGGGGGSSTYYKDPLGFQWDTPGPQRTQFTSGDTGPWTETQTLSPYMQQRFDMAQQRLGQANKEMQPLSAGTLQAIQLDPNFEGQQQEQAYKFATSHLDPQWQQQELQLRSQLASQGVHPGDPGYQQAMTQFQAQKNAAYDQARSGSYMTGVQAGQTRMQTATQALMDQLQASGWTLGQINALMQGLPGAPGGNASGVNLLGSQLQQSMANQQMQAQLGSNAMGAAGLLGAAAIMSDVNAKEDFADPTPAIEEFLESAEPAEYSYKPEYQSSPLAGEGRFVSPMAQGLERSQIGRQMVVETPAGKVVDYGKSFGAVLASLSHLNKKLNNIMGL